MSKELGGYARGLAIAAAVLLSPGAEASQSLSGGWVTTLIKARAIEAATKAAPVRQAPVAVGLSGGIASYYWQDQMTASGERFNRRALTAAHKTLPIGSMVRVTHEATGRAVIVRINDRGPFTPGRVIDLSEAAAEQIGMTSKGLARVRLDLVR
jgi:rare lipoprotein A